MRRRKYQKRAIGLPGLLFLLLLAFVLVVPLLSAAGGNTSGAGGGIAGPTPSTPTEPGVPDEPGTDTPAIPGEPGTDTPTVPENPKEDEGGVTASGLAYAVGRVDAAGRCLHNRYRYVANSDGNEFSCYYTVYCSRCDELIIGAKLYHQFVDGTCCLCGFSCTHLDENGDGICDLGCGNGCMAHRYGPGRVNASVDDRMIYYYGLTGTGIVNRADIKAEAAYTCTTCGHRCFHQNVLETFTYKSASYCLFEETCTDCGYVFGSCLVEHSRGENGNCTNCGAAHTHSYASGVCTICGLSCPHSSQKQSYTMSSGTHTLNRTCEICGLVTADAPAEHRFVSGTCSVCGYACRHYYVNGTCRWCKIVCSHTWQDGACTVCAYACPHTLTYTYSNADAAAGEYRYSAACACGQGNIATTTNAQKSQQIRFEAADTSSCLLFDFYAGMTWRDLINSGASYVTHGASAPYLMNTGPDMYKIGLKDASGNDVDDELCVQYNGADVSPDDYIRIDGHYTYYRTES